MGIIHANGLKYAQFCSIRFYLSVTKTKITGIPNPTRGQVIGTGTFSGGAGLQSASSSSAGGSQSNCSSSSAATSSTSSTSVSKSGQCP
jgi:hypothetical protein